MWLAFLIIAFQVNSLNKYRAGEQGRTLNTVYRYHFCQQEKHGMHLHHPAGGEYFAKRVYRRLDSA